MSMVRNIGLALLSMMLIFSAVAADISEGKQYTRLEKPVAEQPRVLEFFSFYCPHCYDFEAIYHVPDQIKKDLPEGVKLTKYHAAVMGPLGDDLTRSWAAAISLGVENDVLIPLFEAVQKNQTLKTADDIRNVFIKAGVDGKEYDAAMNSFMVHALALKQKKAAEEFKLTGVPAFYVDGKYQVKNDGMGVSSPEEYGKAFSNVINNLLKLNDASLVAGE